MFHLKPKPRPPWSVGAVTPGNAVDSSAIMSVPGYCFPTVALTSCRKLIASRFWLPPYWLGSHSPSLRE